MKRKDGKDKKAVKRKMAASDPALSFLEEGYRLSPMQARFVREYLVDWNATQAAIRAGYSAKRCSSVGAQLLKKPHVRDAIGKAIRAQASAENISPAEVVQEYARVAFFDPASMYDEYGELKSLVDMPKEARMCIKSIDEYTQIDGSVVRKIKLHDKMEALSKLGKWLGMEGFDSKVTVNWNQQNNYNLNVDLATLSDKELQVLSKIGGVDVIDEDDLLAIDVEAEEIESDYCTS